MEINIKKLLYEIVNWYFCHELLKLDSRKGKVWQQK